MLPDIYSLLDELQTMARNGLFYAEEPYDRERYERLMAVTNQSYSALTALPELAIQERFAAELGYITPKVGSDGAIFNEAGEILLMERSDGTGWCLPCGWVEPNERPVDAIVREVYEETGLEVEIGPLVGVFTRMPSAQNGPHTMVAIVHLCKVIGGKLTLSHEGLDLRYWSIDEMVAWHGNHEKYARAAYKAWQSQTEWAISD